MVLVLILDFLAVASLLWVATRKGFEQALPLAAFLLIIFPEESKLPLGLFDMTSQRLVTLTLLALSMFAKRATGGPIRKLPLKLPIIAMTLWWTLATLNSISFVDSLKALLALGLDYLVIYYLFAKNITSTETIRKVLYGFTFGLILCCFFGLLEVYAQWSVVSLFPTEAHRFGASGGLYIDDARGLRAQSTFGHPILFGSALAMGIPTCLYLISTCRSGITKLFLWAGLLPMFTCIFKTSSRGPWMALAFSLLPFLPFGNARFRKYLIVICILAVVVVAARPGVLQTIVDDYLSTVDSHSSQGESYQYRYVLYDLVMQRLDTSPDRALVGFGPQAFPYLHLAGDINGRPMAFASCDSSFAALLAETGYIGFTLTSLLFFGVFLGTVRNYFRLPKPDNRLCIVFAVNFATFLFEMTNVAILGWGQQTILLWVLIAMTSIYPMLVEQEYEQAATLTPYEIETEEDEELDPSREFAHI